VANHPQAKKRNRQRIQRTARSRHVRTTTRTCVKKVRALIEAGDEAGARQALSAAVKQLDRSVTKGVLDRRTASRSVSRLTLAVNKLGAKA
jgi:small subunit ribosomal protein S20